MQDYISELWDSVFRDLCPRLRPEMGKASVKRRDGGDWFDQNAWHLGVTSSDQQLEFSPVDSVIVPERVHVGKSALCRAEMESKSTD